MITISSKLETALGATGMAILCSYGFPISYRSGDPDLVLGVWRVSGHAANAVIQRAQLDGGGAETTFVDFQRWALRIGETALGFLRKTLRTRLSSI